MPFDERLSYAGNANRLRRKILARLNPALSTVFDRHSGRRPVSSAEYLEALRVREWCHGLLRRLQRVSPVIARPTKGTTWTGGRR